MRNIHSINIPCPVCRTLISTDTNSLLSGKQFSCSSCDAKIGISPESQDLTKESLDKFEEMKNNFGK